MSEFVHKDDLRILQSPPGEGRRYRDFLQGQSLVDDVVKPVTCLVSQQTRELVASRADLHNLGIELFDAESQQLEQIKEAAEANSSAISEAGERVREAVEEGFEILHWDIQNVAWATYDVADEVAGVRDEIVGAREDIQAIQQVIVSGTRLLVTKLDAVNDSVRCIAEILRKPSYHSAMEQYADAKTCVAKGRSSNSAFLFEQALKHLHNALHGRGSTFGIPTNPNFHFLMGNILLGEFGIAIHATQNFKKAEESFCRAAECAAQDDPKAASRAYAAAAWAVQCRGIPARALAYLEKAIQLNPRASEAFYLTSRIHASMGNRTAFLEALAKAIRLDARLALLVESENEFRTCIGDVRKLISEETEQARREALCSIFDALGVAVERFFRSQGDEHLLRAVGFYKENTLFGYKWAQDSARRAGEGYRTHGFVTGRPPKPRTRYCLWDICQAWKACVGPFPQHRGERLPFTPIPNPWGHDGHMGWVEYSCRYSVKLTAFTEPALSECVQVLHKALSDFPMDGKNSLQFCGAMFTKLIETRARALDGSAATAFRKRVKRR